MLENGTRSKCGVTSLIDKWSTIIRIRRLDHINAINRFRYAKMTYYFVTPIQYSPLIEAPFSAIPLQSVWYPFITWDYFLISKQQCQSIHWYIVLWGAGATSHVSRHIIVQRRDRWCFCWWCGRPWWWWTSVSILARLQHTAYATIIIVKLMWSLSKVLIAFVLQWRPLNNTNSFKTEEHSYKTFCTAPKTIIIVFMIAIERPRQPETVRGNL